MSERCQATPSGCPVAEYCNELRLTREIEQLSENSLSDLAADTLRAIPPTSEFKQYEGSLYEAMYLLRQKHRSRDGSDYDDSLVSLLNMHGIPADELGQVLAGKLAWTSKKATEESASVVNGIDEQLEDLDTPHLKQECDSGFMLIERAGQVLRMCGSSAISAARREELARPMQ